jgi:hypothetical protein
MTHNVAASAEMQHTEIGQPIPAKTTLQHTTVPTTHHEHTRFSVALNGLLYQGEVCTFVNVATSQTISTQSAPFAASCGTLRYVNSCLNAVAQCIITQHHGSPDVFYAHSVAVTQNPIVSDKDLARCVIKVQATLWIVTHSATLNLYRSGGSTLRVGVDDSLDTDAIHAVFGYHARSHTASTTVIKSDTNERAFSHLTIMFA